MSTTEAEYMTAAKASKENLWLTRLVRKLDIKQGGIQMHCDSHNFIYLSNNQVYNAKTKHINVSFHDSRELLVFG